MPLISRGLVVIVELYICLLFEGDCAIVSKLRVIWVVVSGQNDGLVNCRILKCIFCPVDVTGKLLRNLHSDALDKTTKLTKLQALDSLWQARESSPIGGGV